MNILSVRGVSRTFSSEGRAPTVALQATDLDVAENDFITILGPSGCGKSTLLRIVAGLDQQSSGEVLLDGKRITGPGPDRGRLQSYTLFPWLTVLENVCFGLREATPCGATRRCQRLHKKSACGFESHFRSSFRASAAHSAGASLIRMLLMDEPFGALDHLTRELMQELLLGIWEAEHGAVLFVTHDIGEAVFMGSRVMVMSARPGRISSTALCLCRTRAATQ